MGNQVNAQTRTVKVLARIPNSDHSLKPGMFTEAHLVMGLKQNVMAVPEQSIPMDEGLHVVFVEEGNDYHRHLVKVGITSSGWTEILEGLEPDAHVVVKGQYQLLARQQMQGIDTHAGHVH